MTETSKPILERLSARTAVRIGWAILIPATLYVCYFSHLGAIGFVGPDEPRYAWIARDMAETGDWVTPRLYGKPWFEKPVLYYWGAALSFKLFGVSEAAARLPSAVSALLATFALAWLAWRLYGTECAQWLLLLLPTSAGMIGFSHAAATDMPFSGMLTMVMVCAAVGLGLTRAVDDSAPSRTPWLALILFGFFLGAAVLAKGPAAIILCGGAVLFWALFTKRWRDALRMFHPAAIAAFCLTALPWYILCARRNPEFFRVFIIEHNFKRYLTPEFQHIQPFWYYGPILLIAFLPWMAVFLWTFVAGSLRIWRTRRLSAGTCFLLCWAAFCVGFFTNSQSKLPGYILPSVTAIGLILARSCTLLAPENRKSFGAILFATALLFLGLMEFLERENYHALKRLAAFGPLLVALLLLFAIVNALLGAGFLFTGKGAVRSSLMMFSVLPILLPLADAEQAMSRPEVIALAPGSLAHALQAQRIPVNQLALLGVSRGTRYSLNFYLRADLKEWDRDASREAFVLSHGHSCNEQPPEMACSDLWGNLDLMNDWKLLHVTPKTSTNEPAGRRKTQ